VTAGGHNARYIARWDGSTWSPLGSGLNSEVLALAAYGGKLFAGGFFTTPAAIPPPTSRSGMGLPGARSEGD